MATSGLCSNPFHFLKCPRIVKVHCRASNTDGAHRNAERDADSIIGLRPAIQFAMSLALCLCDTEVGHDVERLGAEEQVIPAETCHRSWSDHVVIAS